jgi:hypothetical protein
MRSQQHVETESTESTVFLFPKWEESTVLLFGKQQAFLDNFMTNAKERFDDDSLKNQNEIH